MTHPDKATLRDWLYALSHMAVIASLMAFIAVTLYVTVLNARDKTPLCAPDTSPTAKAKP